MWLPEKRASNDPQNGSKRNRQGSAAKEPDLKRSKPLPEVSTTVSTVPHLTEASTSQVRIHLIFSTRQFLTLIHSKQYQSSM